MAQKFRIALAQINTTVGDLAGNSRKIIDCIGKAEQAGADLLLFPEMTVPSYFPEDLLLKKRFVEENQKYIRQLADHKSSLAAVVGYVEKSDNDNIIYNAAAILYQGQIAVVCHKICLPNYSVFDEKRYFTSGKRPLVFNYRDILFGLNICEDIWVPDGVTESQAFAGGAEVILSISASPYYKGKRKDRLQIGMDRARFTRSIVVYLNLIGGQDELVFDGNSFVVDHQGEIIAECKQFKEDFLVVDLDISAVRNFRQKDIQYKQDKATYRSLYQPEFTTLAPPGVIQSRPAVSTKQMKVLSEYAEVYAALVLGIQDYAQKNGFKKAVIGLSGGIDSALTAAIAADALGRENVVGILMPSEITAQSSIDDALRLAGNLGIESKIIPIKQAFLAYKELLRDIFQGLPENITEENIQARIRGNILMALSNKFGWLVLTTGNKSETSVGYCTLYGDMAGGFALIKDVPKTMVYKLCDYKNSQAGREVIPREIIVKAPTAELRPDQKDEDSLPPYELLDAILLEYIEKDKTVSEIITQGFPAEIVKKVASLVDINEYKRRQAPPGIKITQKAFGKDRRMPITNRFNV